METELQPSCPILVAQVSPVNMPKSVQPSKVENVVGGKPNRYGWTMYRSNNGAQFITG